MGTGHEVNVLFKKKKEYSGSLTTLKQSFFIFKNMRYWRTQMCNRSAGEVEAGRSRVWRQSKSKLPNKTPSRKQRLLWVVYPAPSSRCKSICVSKMRRFWGSLGPQPSPMEPGHCPILFVVHGWVGRLEWAKLPFASTNPPSPSLSIQESRC